MKDSNLLKQSSINKYTLKLNNEKRKFEQIQNIIRLAEQNLSPVIPAADRSLSSSSLPSISSTSSGSLSSESPSPGVKAV